jgi:hypothetical protein
MAPERLRSTRVGLSDSPRPPAAHKVRPEEANEQGHWGEGKIAVDVIAMVEEVSVNHFVDDDDHHHDQQPNPQWETRCRRTLAASVSPIASSSLPGRGLLVGPLFRNDARVLGTIFDVLRCTLDRQEPALAPLHPDLGFRLQFEGGLIQTSEPNLDECVTGTDWIKQSRPTERAEATSTVA